MNRLRLVLPVVAAVTLVAGSTTALAAPSAAPGAAPATATALTALTTGRLAGSDRYKTAVAISKANFVAPQDSVVVASGQSFPDALGAGPMGAFLNAPLLLVPTSGTLPSSVAAELDRLQTQQIIVVGGPAAVSNSMVAQLAKHAPANATFTIDGLNRYDTAAQTSDGFQPPITGVPVYLASGTTFPDALGGGAAAAIAGGTLLLTTPTKLPSETVTALKRIKPSKVVVLGGTGAISDTVLGQVKSTVGSAVPVTRVGGANRFETAAKVSAATVPSAQEVFLANGMNYPDAMAGAPVSIYGPGDTFRPLLLTQANCVPKATLAEITRLGATKVTALGGTAAVSDAALSLKPC